MTPTVLAGIAPVADEAEQRTIGGDVARPVGCPEGDRRRRHSRRTAFAIAVRTFASEPLMVSPSMNVGDDPRAGEGAEVRGVLGAAPLDERVAAVDDDADAEDDDAQYQGEHDEHLTAERPRSVAGSATSDLPSIRCETVADAEVVIEPMMLDTSGVIAFHV